MAKRFTGSNQAWQFATSPVVAFPLTLACRFRILNVGDGVEHYLCGMFDQFNDDGLTLRWVGSNRRMTFASKLSGATSNTPPIHLLRDTNWHCAAGVVRSSTSRFGYLDNQKSAEQTSSQAVPTLFRSVIGGRSVGDGSYDASTGHEVADYAVWAVALSDAEIARFVAGASPLSIRPDALRSYIPAFGGDVVDLVRGDAWSVTGSPIDAPSAIPLVRGRRQRLFAVANVAGADATANGTTTAVALSLVDGAVSAGSTTTAATLTTTTSLIDGAASASYASAAATLTATASLVDGVATASSTAAGVTLAASLSLVDGVAASGATASGATLTTTASVVSGAAAASSSAGAATLTATLSLIDGVASGAGDATAAGATLAASVALLSGSATASSTIPGVTLGFVVSVSAGQATDGAPTSSVDRMFRIEAEARTFVIAAEARAHQIAAESRAYQVANEDREFLVERAA